MLRGPDMGDNRRVTDGPRSPCACDGPDPVPLTGLSFALKAVCAL